MASGFEQTEGQQVPMRIMKIIDNIPSDTNIKNYIRVISEIRGIIAYQYKFSNVYHINKLAVEVLYYIQDFNELKEIHESSVWCISDMEVKKKRNECTNACNIT